MPRQKKSKQQAERDGTYRKDRHKDAARIAAGSPVKPPGMSRAASELFDVYVPLMSEAGILEQIDGLGLAQIFEAYVLAMRARDVVGDEPVIEDDPFNDGRIVLKKHPGVTAWKDAVSVLRGLLGDFGMSPLARTRMGDVFVKPGEGGPALPDGAPAVWKPRVVGDE